MSSKLHLHDLAPHFAQKAQISPTEAEQFTQSFFDLLQEALQQDRFVKITNFGTMKMLNTNTSDDTANEDETANDGESEAQASLVFTADPLLRDLVNLPFSHFTPIKLHDTTSNEELDSADHLPGTSDDEPAPNTSTLPIMVLNQDDEEWQAQQSSLQPNNTATENTAQPEHSEQAEASPTPPPTEAPTDTIAEQVPEVAPTISEETASTSAKNSTEEGESYNAQVQATLHQAPREQTTQLQGTIRIEAADRPKGKDKTNLWKNLAFVCLLCILCLLSYWAGYKRLFNAPAPVSVSHNSVASAAPTTNEDSLALLPAPKTDGVLLNDHQHIDEQLAGRDSTANNTHTSPQNNNTSRPAATSEGSSAQATQPAQASSVPQASNKGKEKPTKPSNTNEKTSAQPAKKEDTAPKAKTYVVHKGENIYQIAEKLFGSKAYAKKIIEHNKLSTPNHITEGQVLQVPEVK